MALVIREAWKILFVFCVVDTIHSMEYLPAENSPCNQKDPYYQYTPNCTLYLKCIHKKLSLQACPNGTAFNPILKQCDSSYLLPCLLYGDANEYYDDELSAMKDSRYPNKFGGAVQSDDYDENPDLTDFEKEMVGRALLNAKSSAQKRSLIRAGSMFNKIMEAAFRAKKQREQEESRG